MTSPRSRSEITWSIMHPTTPDAGHMRALLGHAKRHRVDSFEICGECHGPYGGMEGIIAYEKYPAFHKLRDLEKIEENRRILREILHLAHNAGKPVYYWHREVMVPPALTKVLPALFDENEEFDLLGETYASLLVYKIAATFEALPELDGIVLTLTESDFSVIHNSRPDRYPSSAVVARIAGIFSRELAARSKRFILRSFGSISQDYEDILAGADEAAKDSPFEVETKINPYDFDPFLPVNPYLRRGENTALGAEFDCVGEFLGAGRLPAANVQRIVGYVRAAQERRVDRFVIRLDRAGVSIFDTSYEINLHAYHRAIDDAEATPEGICDEWARRHWPGCETEMRAISASGIRAVEKINFISGNIIFHTFPLDPGLKWVKAGGIFSVFKEDVPLTWQSGIWSILSETRTPANRRDILREKDEALELADRTIAAIEALGERLSPDLLERLRREWGTAREVARLYRAFCRAVCAYFDDMEREDPDGAGLAGARSELKDLFSEFLTPQELEPPIPAHAGEQGSPPAVPFSHAAISNPLGAWRDALKSTVVLPLWTMLRDLREEYAAEWRARARWRGKAGDFILFGAATDEWRTRRFMHASHSRCEGGRLSREVGNAVFPNGFVEFQLSLSNEADPCFVLETAAMKGQAIQITLDDHKVRASLSDGCVTLPLIGREGGPVRVRLEKSGRRHPHIYAAAIRSRRSIEEKS